MSSNPPSDNKLTGRLRKYHSNFYYVDVAGTLYECALRGMLKKEGVEVLVGDFVELDSVDMAHKTARVHHVLERKNQLSRPKVANVDQVVVVYSLREPDFDPQQMDRYLTHIQLAKLHPILCISKCDLADTQDELEEIKGMYQEQLGYPMIFTSVHQKHSLESVLNLSVGKITVLAGPSGSGKSSLLNAIDPGLKLRVGEISEKISRGQHTTRHVELLGLGPDTFFADTPGFSQLKFNTVMPTEIEAVFTEFAPYREQCGFSNCLHLDEEGCAVRENPDSLITSRYESYRTFIAEARQFKAESMGSSSKEEFGYKKLHRKGKEEIQILRLKDKDRDASRRTQRQQVSQLLEDGEEPQEDAQDVDGALMDEFLVEEPPNSI